MSLYGIRPNPLATTTRTQPTAPRVDRQPIGLPIPARAPASTPVERSSAAGAAVQALPAQAPPGTDPELWAVLSADERTFFAKAGAMGPLTYGRMMAGGQYTPASPAAYARGGRIDVKA